MTGLKDLKAVATAKPLESMGKEATLSLDAEDEIDRAVHALGRFFAEDDSQDAVRLEVSRFVVIRSATSIGGTSLLVERTQGSGRANLPQCPGPQNIVS